MENHQQPSFCGWISGRCSFTIPAPSSRYNMPIWLRSHRDGVTHDMLWFAQFIFRCSFQYHLFKPDISIISNIPLIIFNESFKNINPQMFWTHKKRHDSKIHPKSAGHQPMARWSFGVLVYVILVGQFPIGQSRRTKSGLTRNIIKVEKAEIREVFLGFRLDLVVISWDFTGFSGFTQSFLWTVGPWKWPYFWVVSLIFEHRWLPGSMLIYWRVVVIE